MCTNHFSSYKNYYAGISIGVLVFISTLHFFGNENPCKNFENFKTKTFHEVVLLKLVLELCKEKNSENDDIMQILKTYDYGFWDYNISDFANETFLPDKELK